LTTALEDRQQFAQTSLNSLSQTDTRRMSELDRYAAQTREDVYRGFELLDELQRELELKRAEQQSRPQQVTLSRDISLTASLGSNKTGQLKLDTAGAPELALPEFLWVKLLTPTGS
jgi:hypothetical protein